MRLKPFFTYTGGKYRLAPRYPAPEFGTIIEPFAGSAGYSLRYPEHDVVLVDLSPEVATLWEYLISASPEDILALPIIDGSWESTDELTHLSPGQVMVIRGWLNKGTFGKRPSAWARRWPDEFWGPKLRERVASQVPYIKHWKVVHGEYWDAPDVAATWFVDPPYQEAGKTYDYGHSDLDFDILGCWCQQRRGQVIVCENVGATWLPFEPFHEAKAMHASYRTGVSKEAVWLGGPI